MKYDPNSLSETSIEPNNNNATTVTDFDTEGNVTQVQDPTGAVTTATYSNNLPTTVTQEDGNGNNDTTTLTYDASGNPLSSTDPNGNVTRYTYGPFGTVQTVSDPLGNTTTNEYDDKGNLLQTTSAEGVVTSFGYDAHGNLTSASSGGALTQMSYDSYGELASTTTPTGVTTTYTYDKNGNQTGSSMTWVNPDDPLDQQTLTTVNVYDADDQLIDSTDEQDNTTQTKYDALGRAWETIDARGQATVTLFDVRNEAVQVSNPDGTVTRTIYDAEGRATYSTDAFVPGGANDPPHVTRTIYDADGRMVGTERWANVSIVLQPEANGNYSTVAQVADGRSFDPNNLSQYDNLPADEQPVLLSSTSTEYNSLGQVSQETDAAGLVTKYTYDAAGQETAVTEVTPNGHQITTTTTYDAAGRAIAATDALDNTTQSTYDGDGQLIKTAFADGSSIEYGYDSNGRKISETDQLGNTTNYEYDAEGHLTAVVGPAVIDPTTAQSVRPRTEYSYDQYGNLLTEKDALGHVTSFTYDPFGNETSRTLPQGQGDTTPPMETMTYNSFNQPVTYTDFAGNVTVNQYDPNLGRLTETDYYAAGHDPSTDPPDEQVTTQYNTLGQVSQVSDSDYGMVTYA